MIVDHQAHWYSPDYLDSIVGRSRYPRAERLPDGRYRYELSDRPGSWRFDLRANFTDIEQNIADMDASGIGASVVSANMLADGAADVELSEAREIHEFLNAEIGRVQAEHPGRIIGLCTLPLQDTEAALEELERAAKLDLRGLQLLSNVAGKLPVERENWPVFERLEELRMPVFIHPASDSMLHERGLIPILDSSLGWVCETSLTALTMIMNGLLDHCPELEVVHAHLGGVVPYVAGRTSRYIGYLDPPIEHPLEHYLKTRFYADLVAHTPGAPALASDFYGADRILYGSDYPWGSHPETLEFVEQHVSADLAQKALHENRVATLRLT